MDATYENKKKYAYIIMYYHIMYRSAISEQFSAKCQTQPTHCSGYYNSLILDLHLSSARASKIDRAPL